MKRTLDWKGNRMTGWAMFWIFCIVFIGCVEIEYLVANARERWLVKNGYSYEPEKKCWVKRVKELNK